LICPHRSSTNFAVRDCVLPRSPDFVGIRVGATDIALRAESGQLPIQPVTCRSCFIVDSQVLRIAELANQSSNALGPVGDDSHGSDFNAGLSDGDGNGIRVDIETDKSYFTHETDSPFECGSALLRQRNPRKRETRVGRFLFYGQHAPTGLEAVRA
jgi:hypothetical protein